MNSPERNGARKQPMVNRVLCILHSYPVSLKKASADFIVRDFSTSALALHHNRLRKIRIGPVGALSRRGHGIYFARTVPQYEGCIGQISRCREDAVERSVAAVCRLSRKASAVETDGQPTELHGTSCPKYFTGNAKIYSKLEWSVSRRPYFRETIVHL